MAEIKSLYDISQSNLFKNYIIIKYKPYTQCRI